MNGKYCAGLLLLVRHLGMESLAHLMDLFICGNLQQGLDLALCIILKVYFSLSNPGLYFMLFHGIKLIGELSA